ncbi:MAG: Tol-Pal system beta propeller repeat protein TolB [Rickettsiales bacterium]|nr:Tol-Pal system beta propeller repeat protein TolB [Rickettsiales bacterium]
MLLRLIITSIAFLAFSSAAQAQLKLDISQGGFEPLPIAVADFSSNDAEAARIGRDMAQVIAADLERSGLFRPLDKSAFIEQVGFTTNIPRFADWRQINASGLVIGSVVPTGPGKVKVSFRLWDIYGEQQVAGKQYDTFNRNWRRISHLIADEIYKRITGEEGYFDTRIVYVSESGPKSRRVKRLAIMDQDGENHKFLTAGNYLVLTPRFAPDTQEIVYLSYAGKVPRVYLRDLQTGREESLGTFQGMSFAPRFNADGTRLSMSIAKNGNTDIFEMDLRSRNLRRLTDSPSIDTSPSYSPDGRQMVFNSDRGGSQQLYIMNADGSGVKRLSFGDGRYGTPVWSPRGDYVAFTKIAAGRFFIGIMRSDGSGERMLHESWLAEGPTWAPNGRVIMFNQQSSPNSSTKLYSVDVTGRNLRQLTTPVDATDPAWSPLLPL